MVQRTAVCRDTVEPDERIHRIREAQLLQRAFQHSPPRTRGIHTEQRKAMCRMAGGLQHDYQDEEVVHDISQHQENHLQRPGIAEQPHKRNTAAIHHRAARTDAAEQSHKEHTLPGKSGLTAKSPGTAQIRRVVLHTAVSAQAVKIQQQQIARTAVQPHWRQL